MLYFLGTESWQQIYGDGSVSSCLSKKRIAQLQVQRALPSKPFPRNPVGRMPHYAVANDAAERLPHTRVSSQSIHQKRPCGLRRVRHSRGLAPRILPLLARAA